MARHPVRRLSPLLLAVCACALGGCGRALPERRSLPVPAAVARAPVAVLTAPLPTGLGSLRFPVPGGRIVGGFGFTERGEGVIFRPYLLIRSAHGDAAEVAVASGTVVGVHDDPVQLGLYAMVGHTAAWVSVYGGCAEVLVATGGEVPAGSPVCTLLRGGTAVFGLLLNGQPVNPRPYLVAG